MSLRLLQIIVPGDCERELRGILDDHPAKTVWVAGLNDGLVSAGARVLAENAEPLMDRLQEAFGGHESFQALLLPLEAALPRESEPEPEQNTPGNAPDPRASRIGREELLADIEGASRISSVFVAMVILSAVVAAFGLMRDNVAVVIGAMVIAPLLGPNIALSLGTTLGDVKLIRRAAVTNAVGVAIALGVGVLIGLVFRFDPSTPEIASRLEPGLIDLVLAVAAGVAGALAFTTGAPQAVVGVMVAVALLPPTMVLGMLLGDGQFGGAMGAATLLGTNVIAINLAGTGVFLAMGIRPQAWWEAERARRATRVAIVSWSVLLAVLIVILLVAHPELVASGEDEAANSQGQ